MPNFFLSHKRVKVAGHMLAAFWWARVTAAPRFDQRSPRESGPWRILKNDAGNKKRPGTRGVSDFS
jgi:hypothetical protein